MKTFRYYLTIACLVPLLWACESIDYGTLINNPEEYERIYVPQAVDVSQNITFLATDKDKYMIVNACYGGVEYPKSDIKVRFDAMPEAVQSFNKANYTSYPIMPEGSYEISENESIIPAGKTTSSLIKIKVDLEKLAGVGKFLLPIQMTSSDRVQISPNRQTAYYLVNKTYKENPFTSYAMANWDITPSSEEASRNEFAINLLDSDPKTYWCTLWRREQPIPPHWVVIDMKETKSINGMKFRSRLTISDLLYEDGTPRDVEIATSHDGITWGYAEKFAPAKALDNTVYLGYTQSARYIKLTINASYGDTHYTHLAGLEIF